MVCSTKNKTVPHVIRILKIYSMMQPRLITRWRCPSFAAMVKNNNAPFLTSKRVSYVFPVRFLDVWVEEKEDFYMVCSVLC